MILVIIVVAAALAYFLSKSEAKKFTASTDLYIQVAYPTVSAATASVLTPPTADQLGDVVELVTSSSIQAAVETQIGEPLSAAGSVSAAALTSADFVVITATSKSPTMAARLANTFAREFLAARRNSFSRSAKQSLSAARQTLRSLPTGTGNLTNVAERQNVVSQIQQYEQALLDPTAGASQTSPAAVPREPVSPTPKKDAIFGAAIGLVLGAALAFLLELLDSRLNRSDDFEAAFSWPVLTILPKVRDPAPVTPQPALPNEFLEPMRMLRFQLTLNPGAGAPRTVAVTSGVANEGKSTVSRDLALVYAEAGQRVLLVDADFRKQTMPALFGVTPRSGLAEVLVGEEDLAAAVVRVDLGVVEGSLDLLAGGMHLGSGVNLLASMRMRDFVSHAQESYDIVLFDTAPLLLVADSAPLLSLVDSILVVARAGVVTRQTARRLSQLFERVGDVRVSGTVVNGYEHEGRDGYGYGYGYGYRSDVLSPVAPVSARSPVESPQTPRTDSTSVLPAQSDEASASTQEDH